MNILGFHEKADVKSKEFKLNEIMKYILILLKANYGPLSLRGVARYFELGAHNCRNTTEAVPPKILTSIFPLYFPP